MSIGLVSQPMSLRGDTKLIVCSLKCDASMVTGVR